MLSSFPPLRQMVSSSHCPCQEYLLPFAPPRPKSTVFIVRGGGDEKKNLFRIRSDNEVVRFLAFYKVRLHNKEGKWFICKKKNFRKLCSRIFLNRLFLPIFCPIHLNMNQNMDSFFASQLVHIYQNSKKNSFYVAKKISFSLPLASRPSLAGSTLGRTVRAAPPSSLRRTPWPSPRSRRRSQPGGWPRHGWRSGRCDRCHGSWRSR